MTTASPILLSAMAFASMASTSMADSVARFSNNDRLSGTLEALTADSLIWNSPTLEKPVPIFLKNVFDLSLQAAIPQSNADHDAILTLTNGNTVHGQLASVSDETISLDTWFAGRMNFNRLMVSGVKIEPTANYLFRGPTGMEGWTLSNGSSAWSYAYASFISNGMGGIARKDLLPEECSVTFNVEWKGDSIALKVLLFSEEPTSTNPSSGYELSFQRGSVYLRNGRTQNFLGSAHTTALMESDRVKLEIRASRKSGKICLFVNDRLTEVWSDPDFNGNKLGSCLHFLSSNPQPMRISGITVAPWDGIVDQLPDPQRNMFRRFNMQINGIDDDPPPATQEKKKNQMELANGDSIDGEVTAVQDGMVTMKTSLGEIKIPVSRFRSITLKKVDLETCIRRNGDVRATVPDGSVIVFKLEKVDGDKLIGSSQNFGTATFDMNAFSRIEFNIYDPELEDMRKTREW